MAHFLKKKKGVLMIFTLLLGVIVFIGAVNMFILSMSSELIFQSIEDIPTKQVALVLGAKVYSNGRMSDILKDRELTALELYKNNRVQKILVSGDHGRQDYDEVNTMKDFLLGQGVAEEDIFLDHAGFDTYDSVYRAKAIFQISSVVIVTQDFHLPRALYIAKSLGLDAVGIAADRQKYLMETYNQIRESFSRVKAFFDVILQAKPKFLGDPIPISGDSKLSWD